MKAIENQIEVETQKVVIMNKEQSVTLSNKSQQEINNLEIQFDKKYDELKAEKDELLEELTKMP